MAWSRPEPHEPVIIFYLLCQLPAGVSELLVGRRVSPQLVNHLLQSPAPIQAPFAPDDAVAVIASAVICAITNSRRRWCRRRPKRLSSSPREKVGSPR